MMVFRQGEKAQKIFNKARWQSGRLRLVANQLKALVASFRGSNPLLAVFLKGIDNVSYGYGPPESERIYIGRCCNTIKDYETGKQFKDSVREAIRNIFGDAVECRYCEDAWYDG